jgi:hypothetical protein
MKINNSHENTLALAKIAFYSPDNVAEIYHGKFSSVGVTLYSLF